MEGGGSSYSVDEVLHLQVCQAGHVMEVLGPVCVVGDVQPFVLVALHLIPVGREEGGVRQGETEGGREAGG